MPYDPKFLRGITVDIPAIDASVHPNLVQLKANKNKTVLEYPHHSVIVNKDRRLAIISACNIDGGLIPVEAIPRKGDFSESDLILPGDQLGVSFYEKAKVKGKSILDKGHLTKYEDVIWGKDLGEEEFVALGRSTNFYPNAVPQHQRVNRGKWSSLELYILDTETQENELKICLFTGPVLDDMDPVFDVDVDGTTIQLPVLFWKIVVYQKDAALYALGFLMSHKTLLSKTKLVREKTVRSELLLEKGIYFSDFKHSKPYQVKVEQIEQLAGITMKASKEIIKPYKDDRPLEVITREIDVRGKTLVGKRFLTNTRFTNLVTS